MLHDKANRVRQPPPHYSCRNACSLRYAAHWREWLFIKRCPNCLINSVRAPWYRHCLFVRSPEQSPKVSCNNRVGDCIRTEDCNKLLVWWPRLITLACRKRGKSSAGPLCITLNFNVMIVHFVIETLALWWAERYQSSCSMEWITHHIGFLKLLISKDDDGHSSWC
jgi:hypothetical protein